MKLYEREMNVCKCCNRTTTVKVEETYSCDECAKVIDLNKTNIEYLDIAIFFHDNSKEIGHRQYCSWKCCLKNLRKVKTDYFISLPMLTFDTKTKGLHPRDFFKLVKP